MGQKRSGTVSPGIRKILKAVGKNPDMPITLRCNAGDVYLYQDTGKANGASEYEMKRDLEILHKINLFPGATLPARIIINRIYDRIEDVSQICGSGPAGVSAWKGCPKAEVDNYKKAREKGSGAIIPPRTKREMKKDKRESLAAMYKAGAIKVRPHILVCSVCQYGNGTMPPYPEDNLPELLQLVLKNPDIAITMARCADWMMCAPCPMRAPAINACVNNRGCGGLSNQVRDLRVMQRLGLTYGSTMNARAVYKRILERIPGTLEMCRFDHGAPSVWFCGCGAAKTNSKAYAKGRKLLMAKLEKLN